MTVALPRCLFGGKNCTDLLCEDRGSRMVSLGTVIVNPDGLPLKAGPGLPPELRFSSLTSGRVTNESLVDLHSFDSL